MHAVNAAGRAVMSRALARDKFLAWCAQLPAGCLVVMEVSSSAHHWARKLRALGLGRPDRRRAVGRAVSV